MIGADVGAYSSMRPEEFTLLARAALSSSLAYGNLPPHECSPPERGGFAPGEAPLRTRPRGGLTRRSKVAISSLATHPDELRRH